MTNRNDNQRPPDRLDLTAAMEIDVVAEVGDGKAPLPRFSMVAYTGGPMVVNVRIPDAELVPAKVAVAAAGYQFLGQVAANKVGRFVSWFITAQNAGTGVVTLGYSDDNAGNTAWTPVLVINAAANGGGNRENPNALKALCTPTIPTGKYLGIKATGTAFDGLVVTGVSAN